MIKKTAGVATAIQECAVQQQQTVLKMKVLLNAMETQQKTEQFKDKKIPAQDKVQIEGPAPLKT